MLDSCAALEQFVQGTLSTMFVRGLARKTGEMVQAPCESVFVVDVDVCQRRAACSRHIHCVKNPGQIEEIVNQATAIGVGAGDHPVVIDSKGSRRFGQRRIERSVYAAKVRKPMLDVAGIVVNANYLVGAVDSGCLGESRARRVEGSERRAIVIEAVGGDGVLLVTRKVAGGVGICDGGPYRARKIDRGDRARSIHEAAVHV